MKARIVVLALAVFFASAIVCLADSPHMGTWKLNEAKSKLAPGATKNHTVVYEAVGDQIKVTVDGTDADGNAVHNEWTGKFDGKYYTVTGDPTSDTRAYRVINKHTLAITGKKGGKITLSGRINVTANGKTRTVSTVSTDAKGKRVSNRAVYDKQ